MQFPRHEHHICLVSEQTLPNYLGAIIPNAFPKKVHLIVTNSMKKRADILENAFRNRGCVVCRYPLASPYPADMMEILDKVYAITGKDVAVNVTCGTKVMALTTVEWASIQDERVFLFYVDTNGKKILQIGRKQEEYALNVSLVLKDILYAGSGHKILRQNNTPLKPDERDAVENLVRLFIQNNTTLAKFNERAASSKDCLFCAMPEYPAKEFSEALNIAAHLGKLNVGSQKIVYTSEDARAWCNGLWLEDYIKKTLYQMHANKLIDDWGSNIEIDNCIKKNNNNAWNELDATFTAHNRLYVIECKSSNVQKKNDQSLSIAERATYKLDSLKKTLGGTFAKGMIVCIHKPEDRDIQRCESLGIELLYGKNVLKLEEKIKQWVQNAGR